MSKEIGDADVFSVNDSFQSRLYKVKIGMVVAQVWGEGGSHVQRGTGGGDHVTGWRSGIADQAWHPDLCELSGARSPRPTAHWPCAPPDQPFQPIAMQRESDEGKEETRERVEEDRKPQIEAAIVRIMKVLCCWPGVWSGCARA